jgi:hypothetical protein
MGESWCTVTVIEESGRRHSLDVLASSTFDAAHIFVTHAKADPRNGIPRPTTDTVFEVAVKRQDSSRGGQGPATVDSQGEGGTQRPSRDSVFAAAYA